MVGVWAWVGVLGGRPNGVYVGRSRGRCHHPSAHTHGGCGAQGLRASLQWAPYTVSVGDAPTLPPPTSNILPYLL